MRVWYMLLHGIIFDRTKASGDSVVRIIKDKREVLITL